MSSCFLAQLEEDLGVEELIPGVGHARKAPMAAILILIRVLALCCCKPLLPVDRWMGILSVVCHGGDVQVSRRGLHIMDHGFQHVHLRWVEGDVALICYRCCLVVAFSP